MTADDNELQAAIAAALAAGEILRAGYGTRHSIEFKGPTNMVTEVDRASEQRIIAMLQAATPGYGFLAEESETIRSENSARWIVDPLDGTTNFAHGLPYFSVSIGLERHGEPVLGVIYNPLLDELYVGRRGGGATLNGRPIHVSGAQDLAHALLTTGWPYDAWTSSRDNLAETSYFLKRAISVRVSGSASLDMAAIACGRLDGHWEPGLYPYDVAAGAVIVREAGGLATDYAGGPDCLYSSELLAANPAVHAQMLEYLRTRHQEPSPGR
ncbi:MAG: inositol monophosphatase family protein [Anaerolineae bacterium]